MPRLLGELRLGRKPHLHGQLAAGGQQVELSVKERVDGAGHARRHIGARHQARGAQGGGRAVFHGDAQAAGGKHLHVVVVVAEGHDLIHVDAKAPGELPDGPGLAHVIAHDFRGAGEGGGESDAGNGGQREAGPLVGGRVPSRLHEQLDAGQGEGPGGRVRANDDTYAAAGKAGEEMFPLLRGEALVGVNA